MTELTHKTITELREGFRSGDFSAREIAEAFNAAVAAGRQLNAYTVETPELALAAADIADRDRTTNALKPLSGIPITTFGCPPEMYWHSRQWHWPLKSGSPSAR